MIDFFKKNKKIFISIIFLFLLTLFYLVIDNKCLNLNKVIKSYKDFGYTNVRPCYLKSTKSIILQKMPRLFSILSDINRHYFGRYDKDILELREANNYESRQNELFENVINLAKNGMLGVVNDKQFKSDTNFLEYSKSYSYYFRQNKDHSSTKFYNEINIGEINDNNKPQLAWKHVSLDVKSKPSKWKRLVETSPVYINGKIIYVSADLRLIALSAENGQVLWEKELLHNPSMRGFIAEIDLNNNENLYIGIGSNIFKIEAKSGKIQNSFGINGSVQAWTAFSPVIFKDNLIVVSRNVVYGFDTETGEKKIEIKIFDRKNYSGALPWGGMSLDEKRGIIYFGTGNPRPKIYGVKRQGINEGSNSIIAVDLIEKKVKWRFKETFHDLWNLDVAFPPILAKLRIENKDYDAVVSATKVGNILMLERSTGRPIFDINYIKAPNSKINSEIVSPYQIQIKKPEQITKFDWSPNDISDVKSNLSASILKNLSDYEYGLFVPPELNKPYIYMAEGPIWEGGAYNLKKKKIYLTVNQTSTIIRPYLKSIWPHSNVLKNFSDEFKIYKNYCSSCHGINRNGKYVQGKKPENKQIETLVIPSLVGNHLFSNSKIKINNFENYKKKHTKNMIDENSYKKINLFFDKWDKDLLQNNRITVNEMSSLFVDENKNFMNNYPQGEIVSYDIESGKIDWRVPFGYENGKNVGTFNKGGLSISNDGILFATGTPDKKIYALNSFDGKELWSYEMELSGNAPPIMYKYNGSNYISVIATGGYNFKFPERGSILYTFKIN